MTWNGLKWILKACFILFFLCNLSYSWPTHPPKCVNLHRFLVPKKMQISTIFPQKSKNLDNWNWKIEGNFFTHRGKFFLGRIFTYEILRKSCHTLMDRLYFFWMPRSSNLQHQFYSSFISPTVQLTTTLLKASSLIMMCFLTPINILLGASG